MFLENLNVNLIVKHLIQTKIGIVISIKVNATNQWKTVYSRMITLRIKVYVLVSVTKSVSLMNI